MNAEDGDIIPPSLHLSKSPIPLSRKVSEDADFRKPKPLSRKTSEDVDFKKQKPVTRKISEDESSFVRSEEFDDYLLQEAKAREEQQAKLKQLRHVVLRGLKYKETNDKKVDVVSGSISNLAKFVISRASEGLATKLRFIYHFGIHKNNRPCSH